MAHSINHHGVRGSDSLVGNHFGGCSPSCFLVHENNRKMPRTRGRAPSEFTKRFGKAGKVIGTLFFISLYIVGAFVILLTMPEVVQDKLFSPAGVVVVGTVFPIVESIITVCTISAEDDKTWLQYWIAQASFSYATEFVDIIAENAPFVKEHWYEFEFFFMVWLFLPFTDGATLLYDTFTKPYLVPRILPLVEKCEGLLTTLVLSIINCSHLGFLWFTFVMMPGDLKRFVVVATGTLFPLMASIVCVATEDEVEETFWLTYWSCFGILFLVMDWAEELLGAIPGFYSLCLVATVYLMLPLFRGADEVFRNVLVPLAGQRDQLLVRDAHVLHKEMIRQVPAERIDSVRAATIAAFMSTATSKKQE